MHTLKICFAAAAALCAMNCRAQPDWTGFYLGADIAQLRGRSDVTTDAAASEVGYAMVSANWDSIHASGLGLLKPEGTANGFTAGFNWQHRHGFLGLEADHSRFHESSWRTVTRAYPIGNVNDARYTITQGAWLDGLSTLRLRAGFASARWLVFATAGAARTRLGFREVFTDDFDCWNAPGCIAFHESGEVSQTRNGRAWGGGAEFRFAGRWSVKGDYLHARFGALSGRSDNLRDSYFSFPMNYFTYSADLGMDVMRLGVNYRF